MNKLRILIIGLLYINSIIIFQPSGLISALDEFEKAPIFKSQFENYTVIEDGIGQKGLFTNDSQMHNWLLEDLALSQVVFFSIYPNNSLIKSELSVKVFNPIGIEIIFQETPYPVQPFLGSWTVSSPGNWYIQVGISTSPNNQSYTILVSIPETKFNEASAELISESQYLGNFSHNHEVHYWKVVLAENQNGTLFLKEGTPNVLLDSEITIYPRSIGLQNPVIRGAQIKPAEGSYNFTWIARSTDTYIIRINHLVQLGFPIGTYNISFSAQSSGYNFDTANILPHNKTISVNLERGYTPRIKFYFWFEVNSSPSIAKISVFEFNFTTNSVLDFAIVEIFDEWGQNRLFIGDEGQELRDGEINYTDTLDGGKYYLVISPQSNAVGTFGILYEVRLPKPFIWNPFSIFLTFIFLLALPGSLIYINHTGRWYRIDQWTVEFSLEETYKFFKYNFSGLFNIKEVPNDSILIRISSIPLPTFGILNFIESSESETLVFCKRIKRRIEWVMFLLIGFFIFDIVNLIYFTIFSQHLLPFYIANLTELFLSLAGPTVILAIFVLFINISSYITYTQLVSRVNFIVNNYAHTKTEGIITPSIDPAQALKNINYVRVLWNQAKHAFKENNYELFVIKADAAVKNLLTTRYLQIVSNNLYDKPDFQVQITELRERGFDLPNDKKIAHFRNLRNRIVHSSVTLDEKESVDCFAFYSTFITRLGLRPT
ncbi:hypothetical protein [Candidatus Hodarchaeum mangrovi]